MATSTHPYALRDPQNGEIFNLAGGLWTGENQEVVGLLNVWFARSRLYLDDPGRYLPDPDWQLAQDAAQEMGFEVVSGPPPETGVPPEGNIY